MTDEKDAAVADASAPGAAGEAGIPVYVTGISLTLDGRNGGVFFRKVPALDHLNSLG